jgi:flagellar basal-body rod protein FlgG
LVQGIRTAAAGMMAQMAAQDVSANNLANANTAGFKRDVPSFGAVLAGRVSQPAALPGHMPALSVVEITPGAPDAAPAGRTVEARTGVDRSQGALNETGDPLNLALEGDGYFAVQTQAGVAYTRNGAFTRGADGYLVTQSGDQVLGERGPIRLDDGEVTVDEQGRVAEGGAVVDTLRVVRLSEPDAAVKTGASLWRATGPVREAPGTRVRQGFLEASNVNSISEMVTMISGFRTYEASQKAIQAQDATLDKLVNDVGRV